MVVSMRPFFGYFHTAQNGQFRPTLTDVQKVLIFCILSLHGLHRQKAGTTFEILDTEGQTSLHGSDSAKANIAGNFSTIGPAN